VITWDVLRARTPSPRNPWNAGTLEWLIEMPGENWGVRSIPEISSRYPLWDQPNLMRDVDEGRFFLPDAEEGKREMLITSIIDARPVQCLRVPGPTFITLAAAVFTGGIFIFSTFHWWWSAVASGVAAVGAIMIWLWTGTAIIPEKPEKAIGLGVTLPLYASGSASVGWWAMFITMLGDMTAFLGLVFGYFFYWTARRDFLDVVEGPGVRWPAAALALGVVAWLLTLWSRRANRRDRGAMFQLTCGAAVLFALGSSAALIAAPLVTELHPERDAYAAMVWVLVIWTAAHLLAGALMDGYCMARRAAGRLSARHDIDIATVSLYWHFAAITLLITVGVIAGFPAAAS
jgi:cytochrome c oxidase subunit I+III